MSPIRKLKEVMALLLLGAAGSTLYSWHLVRETARLEREAAAFVEARTGVEFRAAQIERALEAARSLERDRRTVLAGLQSGPPDRSSRSTSITPAPRRANFGSDALLADPVTAHLQLALERAALPAKYTPLLRRLGLSAAQAEKVRDLVWRRNQERMDLAAVLQTYRLPEQDAAVADLRVKADRTFCGEMASLLGESLARAFEDAERTLPAWELVNEFAGVAALEGQPLNEAQANQLATVLAEASPSHCEGGPVDPNQLVWPVVVAKSVQVLTPPQQILFLNLAPRYPVEDRAAEFQPPEVAPEP